MSQNVVPVTVPTVYISQVFQMVFLTEELQGPRRVILVSTVLIE